MATVSNIKLVIMLMAVITIPNCGSHLNQNHLSAFLEIPKDTLVRDKEVQGIPFTDSNRLYDIFIPETASLNDLSKGNDTRKITISFVSQSQLEDAIAEYRTEMAYLGWEEWAVFDDSDETCCLIFSRPSKLCTIFFEKNNSDYTITLFIGPKQLVNEA